MRPVRQVKFSANLTFPPGRPGDRAGQEGYGRAPWHYRAVCDEERAEGRRSPDDRDASIVHLIDSDKAQPSGINEMVARNTVSRPPLS